VFEIATLSSGSTSANQLLTVRGTVVVDQNFNQVTVNGNQVQVTNGTFAAPILLGPGSNTVTVTISDIAGNSATDARSITYDPSFGQVLIAGTSVPADGAVIAAASLDLAGTAPVGATTVRLDSLSAGTPVSQSVPVTNGAWSAAGVHLDAGLNPIQVTAFNGTSQLASTVLAVTQVGALQPVLAITSPAADLAINTSTLTVSGTVGAAAVSATLDAAVVPVSFTPGAPGTFQIALSFAQEGVHLLAVTATDAFGNSVTSYRSIRFKTTTPGNFTVTPFTGQPTSLSGTLEPGSTLFVKKADGTDIIPPTAVGNAGTWSITLPVGYDPATVNLFALDAAGNSTRNGDINASGGIPDATDAVIAIRIALGKQSATTDNLLRGDVAPLVSHASVPDGKIDIDDILLILRRVVGLSW
ncbi:MAG TPA: Ig-like domain-containing protein, partial [Geobacteraceae bacterium]